MSILKDEELKVIEAAPGGADIAKRIREMGDYIPKSRFDEVLGEKNKHADALAKIEADRKAADDDRAKKAGEFEKLEADRKAQIEKVTAELATEKKTADEYRAMRQAKIDALKKDFGDDWLTEYESFSVQSLDKVVAQRNAKAPANKPDGGKPGLKYEGKAFGDMTPAEQEKYISDARAGKFQNR